MEKWINLYLGTILIIIKIYLFQIPLGGVRVPFNINYEDDIYKDNSMIFHVHNKENVLKVKLEIEY